MSNKTLEMMIYLLACCYFVVSFSYYHGFHQSMSRSRSTFLNVATSADPSTTHKKIIAPVFEESCARTGVTLTRYMIEAVAANPHIRELESVSEMVTHRYFCCPIIQ